MLPTEQERTRVVPASLLANRIVFMSLIPTLKLERMMIYSFTAKLKPSYQGGLLPRTIDFLQSSIAPNGHNMRQDSISLHYQLFRSMEHGFLNENLVNLYVFFLFKISELPVKYIVVIY